MSANDILRANVRRRRKALGLSQAELAQRIGVATPTVSNLERQRADRSGSPTLTTIERYSVALGCTPADLLTPPDDTACPHDEIVHANGTVRCRACALIFVPETTP